MEHTFPPPAEVGNEISRSTERPWFTTEDENGNLIVAEYDGRKPCGRGQTICILCRVEGDGAGHLSQRFANAAIIERAVNQYADLRRAVQDCLDHFYERRDKRSELREVALQKKCAAALKSASHWEAKAKKEAKARLAKDEQFFREMQCERMGKTRDNKPGPEVY